MNPTPAPEQLLGGLSPGEFLSEYWQQKPLLIRQAWTFSNSPLSGDELAGLACETEHSARIVQEHHADGPWHLRAGPFNEQDFANLPESHWTLLVSDCDKHIPELQQLIEPFRFIPDWRIDDLMISYAAEHGSVGPHVDAYDVFLLQLEGQREWQIGGLADPGDCIPDLKLRILKNFHAETRYILEPGDMLYLPPGFAHYGQAHQGSCITASIGFRSPEPRDLMLAWADHIADNMKENAPLRDKALQPHQFPGEIQAETIQAMQLEIQQRLQPGGDTFNRWLGEYLTEARFEEAANYNFQPQQADIEAAVALLKSDQTVFDKNTYSKLAYIKQEDHILFFADGQHWTLTPDCLQDVQLICEQMQFRLSQFTSLHHDSFYLCLTALILAEVIYPDDGS